MSEGYRASHRHKGADYHETFWTLPHRAMLWRMEQRLLLGLVRERFDGCPPSHLDFACGTGRILGHLAPHVSQAVGVDVSASMLSEARRNAPAAELIEVDLTARDPLGDRRFDLITAFRFFPNAEPDLRAAVMRVLAGHLAPAGHLVFNNHKQEGSLLLRAAGMLGRRSSAEEAERKGDRVMEAAEVHALVAGAGLRIVSRHPLGVLPFTDRHMPPARLLEPLESGLAALPGVAPLAQTVVYVCRGTGAGAVPASTPRVAVR